MWGFFYLFIRTSTDTKYPTVGMVRQGFCRHLCTHNLIIKTTIKMKKTTLVFAISLACLSTFTACNKSTPTPTAPSSSAPSVSTPSNADGVLAAVQVITTQTVGGFIVPINIGTAAAWFGSASSYQDAGNVTTDGNALTKSSNAYIFQPTTANPSGLSFTSSTAWVVTGNTANSIAAINYTDNSSFPSITDISTSGTVSTSGSYTLSATSAVSGDSVIFVIAGPNGHVTHTGGPNASSYTFTASEMASVGTSSNNTGLLQIAPYRVNHQTINSKSYYFVKEACVSKFVNLN